jgi:hypothetical protein
MSSHTRDPVQFVGPWPDPITESITEHLRAVEPLPLGRPPDGAPPWFGLARPSPNSGTLFFLQRYAHPRVLASSSPSDLLDDLRLAFPAS